MKTLVYFILAAFLFAGCNKDSPKDTVAARVPGTPVSMPLPKGYYADPNIAGFRHKVYQATILVISAPVPYRDAVLALEKDQLEAAGETLLSNETVTIDGTEGVLCNLSFQADGLNLHQWRLVLPDHGHTLTVNGTFTEGQDKEVSTDLKNALLSIKLSDKPDTSAIAFEIQPTKEMKLAKIFEGPAIMYTADGLWNNTSIFTYSFLCGSRVSEYIDSLSQIDYAVQSFQQICSTCAIDGQDSLKVDGLKGREIWGMRTDSLITRLKYEAILFDSTMCYYMIGTADKDNLSRLKDFRSSARSWKRKNNERGV